MANFRHFLLAQCLVVSVFCLVAVTGYEGGDDFDDFWGGDDMWSDEDDESWFEEEGKF